MFTELLQIEIWRKKLESAGYRVLSEAWEPSRSEPERERDDWRERRRDRSSNPGGLPLPP
jgi:hypothetical protein